MRKTASIFIILFTVIIAKAQDNNIVGVWQNESTKGAGWSNTYLFFPDGTFKFFYSQSDCAKRDVSYSGTWSVKDDELRLVKEERIIVVGGELQKSDSSCATGFMIVGGVEKKLKVKHHNRETCSVSQVYREERAENPKDIIYIDAIKFWRFSTAPDEVLKDFEK
jgi:hypothetical protein